MGIPLHWSYILRTEVSTSILGIGRTLQHASIGTCTTKNMIFTYCMYTSCLYHCIYNVYVYMHIYPHPRHAPFLVIYFHVEPFWVEEPRQKIQLAGEDPLQDLCDGSASSWKWKERMGGSFQRQRTLAQQKSTMANQPSPLIAGLIKGNQRFISPLRRPYFRVGVR